MACWLCFRSLVMAAKLIIASMRSASVVSTARGGGVLSIQVSAVMNP